MRLALFSWETLHSISAGGVAAHVTELGAALQRRGHEVHIFTRQGGWQPWDECIHGVWYHRCGFDLHPNFVDEIQHMCRSFVDRFDGVQRVSGRFDLVHAHDWLASNTMVWIKEGWRTRAVLTLHSTEYGRCGNVFHGGDSERIRNHETHGTYCADRVIAVSQSLKKEVCWIYQVPDWKVAAIYNGVQLQHLEGFVDQGQIKQRYHVGPFDPMILFAGRVTYQKGPDLLLHAMPAVLTHHHDARVVFAGDGDMRMRLEGQAWAMGIGHACRFIGFQRSRDLADLYRAADMVVVPSRNEPFGIVILEAWAAGKPVIVTHNGGPSEFVWHEVNGLRVYDHPNSVSWGICEVLRNREYGRWMGRNGRFSAEQAFAWDTIAAHTERVYYSV